MRDNISKIGQGKKGFIKILEAIISAVILITSLTFFFSTDIQPSGWEDTYMQIRNQDVLYTLVNNGTIQRAVFQNDPALADNTLRNSTLSMILPTMDYSLQIDGIPPPVIYIGCNCTSAEMQQLQNMLTPLNFQYKGRDIEIRISQDSIDSIRNETQVYFRFGYQNFAQKKQQADSFLKKGGALFVLGDLTTTQINDGYMKQVFDLNVRTGAAPSSGFFTNFNNENLTAFKVSKYFTNITNFTAPVQFDFTGTTQVNVTNKTIIAGGQLSLLQANREIMNGAGRAVWMQPYDTTINETNMLLKSTLLWASGESFKLDVTKKTLPARVSKSSISVFDKDVYKIILTTWTVFQ